MIMLFFISAVPYAPPPKQPVELVVSKEGLAGKEIKIVEIDNNSQEYLPFVCNPELPDVVAIEPVENKKPSLVHKPPKNIPVNSKTSASRYNRRGIRNK